MENILLLLLTITLFRYPFSLDLSELKFIRLTVHKNKIVFL